MELRYTGITYFHAVKHIYVQRFRLLLCLLIGPWFSFTLQAQQYEPGGEWVELSGQKVFRVDHAFGSLSPGERAARITAKLDQVVNDYSYCIDSIEAEHQVSYNRVACGDLTLYVIADEDTVGTRLNREQLTGYRVLQTRNALQKIRESRAPRELARQFFSGLTVLGLLISLLWLNSRLFGRLRSIVGRKKTVMPEGLRLRGTRVLRPQVLHLALIRILKITQTLIAILLLYFSLPALFRIFPSTRSWGDYLIRLILFPLNKIISGLIEYLPNLITILIIGFVFYYFLLILRFFARELEGSRIHINGFYPEWAIPTYKILRVPVLAFFLIIIFPYLPGSSTPAFQGITVFLGLILSLGSTNAIGNIMAGIVITYMRPFRIGDRILTGDTHGYVQEKTLLVTRIRSIKNELVTIPNSTLLNNKIVNYTLMAEKGQLLLYTSVTIGYDTRWQKVHELLLEAASRTAGIINAPKAFVLQRSLNDFTITYELNVYCGDTTDLETVYSSLHAAIQDAFNREGVEIMSPHFTSIRDGNTMAMPSEFMPQGEAGGIRIKNV